MFKKALTASLPVFFSYFPLGVVYGALFVEQGHPWYFGPISSFFLVAGALQFLAAALLASGTSLLTLALIAIPLGIRNIFYGLTLLERYKGINRGLKAYLACGLVDATYSILVIGERFEKPQDQRYIFSLTFLIHAYWVLGTCVGVGVGEWLTLPPRLEFTLPAMLMAMGVEQFLKSRDWMPIVLAGGAIVASLLLLPDYFFMAAVGISFLFSLVMPRRQRRVA